MNEFSVYYKTVSNAELLSIIENPDNYQPIAVEAAKAEWAGRRLSESDIHEAMAILATQQEEKAREQEKIIRLKDKARSTGSLLWDTLNPIQPGLPSAQKTIRLIVVVLGAWFLYTLIKDFRLLLIYIKDLPETPFTSALYILPLCLLALALWFFAKRQPTGWTLLAVLLTYYTVVSVGLLIQLLTWKPSGMPLFDQYYSERSMVSTILYILFMGGSLYAICKPAVREVYSVDNKKMIRTTGLTAMITAGYLYVVSM